MRRTAQVSLIGAVLAALLAGCGAKTMRDAASQDSPGAAGPNTSEVNPAGDIPDTQVFVPFSPPGGTYSVKVPEGWARTGSGDTVSFTDKLNTIRIETVPAQAAPTVESASAREVPAIQAGASHFTLGTVTTVRRKAGDAILMTYTADAPKSPVIDKAVHNAVERYEFFKPGVETIITLSGPVGTDNVDPWRTVTDSFQW